MKTAILFVLMVLGISNAHALTCTATVGSTDVVLQKFTSAAEDQAAVGYGAEIGDFAFTVVVPVKAAKPNQAVLATIVTANDPTPHKLATSDFSVEGGYVALTFDGKMASMRCEP